MDKRKDRQTDRTYNIASTSDGRTNGGNTATRIVATMCISAYRDKLIPFVQVTQTDKQMDRQTDRGTDGTENITSTAGTGGNTATKIVATMCISAYTDKLIPFIKEPRSYRRTNRRTEGTV